MRTHNIPLFLDDKTIVIIMPPDLLLYTTFTNFSMKYHLMCKVYTDVSGIK